ncbi:MAG TPA: transposase [Bacteroidia bacterium]|nr:transposase [Bacteroidia bacterium]
MGRGLHYNIREDKTYFMTMTIVDWIDLFTRLNHKMILVDALKYCQLNKGLNIFGWCLMPSHLHIIANTKIPIQLSDVVRDLKRFTSKALITHIKNEKESRREWLLNRFQYAAKIHPKNAEYKVWQDKNHAIELYTEKVTWQKLNYIHRNPVVDKIVYNEQDYLFSSARNYYGLPNVLEIDCLTPPVITTSSYNFFNP